MQLMITFIRAYPWQTLLMLAAMLLAGVAEGTSLSALLPLLNIAVRGGANPPPAAHNAFERRINDLLEAVGITPSVEVMLAVIVIGGTLKGLLLLVANKQVGYTAAQVTTDLRLDLMRAILRCRWEYFIRQPIGRLTNALATEANRSSDAFVDGSLMITLLIQALVYSAVAIAISWKATLAGLLAGLVIVGVSHGFVRMAQRAGKRQTALLASLVARLTDTLQSVKPLKAMAREHLTDAVLAMETARLNRALRRQVFSKSVLITVQEQLLLIVIAAGMFVALVPFGMPLTTVLMLAIVMGSMLRQFSKVQRQYQRMIIGESAFLSLKRTIGDALATREVLAAGRAPVLVRAITFEQVSFGYGERPVLDAASLEIPAGSLTTLIGPSGSGKTTLVDLITGLLQPQSGSLYVDGVPLEQLDLRVWRRMIGYVPQENMLLHDTVLHNVTLGDPELSRADAERALTEAGARDFVAALSDGIDSVVGERGSRLSGGQRQRIMIARALAHRPALLILDEATSALDPASEAAICETLAALRGRLTILAISHQAALVTAADRVYRLEKGVVIGLEDAAPQSATAGR